MKRFWPLLKRASAVIVSTLMLLVACAALILSRPQEEEPVPDPQPLQENRAPLAVTDERELSTLIGDFPAPVMSFMGGSGMVFVSAESSSFRMPGGFGRIAVLNWQTEDGIPMMLQSIYPATALSQLEGGYRFSGIAGPTLFGLPSVRMENQDTIRVHVAAGEGLYVILAPSSLASSLSPISRSLQLFTLQAED